MRTLSLTLPLLFLSVAPFAACSGAIAPVPADGADAGNDVLSTNPPPDAPPSLPPPTGPRGVPSPPPGPVTPATAVRTFAVSNFFLGETTRQGLLSTIAWKSYGYDLDGKISDKASTDVCTLVTGSTKDTQNDGDLGIDNAFGARVVPILQTFTSSLSQTFTASIRKGAFTYLIETTGLTDDPSQTNTGVTGQLFYGATFPGAPTFTKADVWPVLASSLANGTVAGGAKTRFSGAYVSGGTWVGAPRQDVAVSIPLGGTPWTFVVHQAIVSFSHTSAAHVTSGTIAGVVNTEELVASMRAVAGRISDTLCSGSAFESIATQLRQASDMLSDGTNRPGVTCDAVSIGLGFEADEVADAAQVAPDPAPLPNPCP